jgi:diketogulonate reductase-like aldo/keto reductase
MKVQDIVLNNGVSMPAFGFGTWNLAEGEEVLSSVTAALNCGYRLIDTAAIYGNEKGVGEAVRNSTVARDEIFITTKLWTGNQGFESAIKAFEDSMRRLGLEYLDLYLIHWPGRDSDARSQSWKALSDLYKEGLTKAIGVSNYQVHHLEEVLEDSDIVPAVNQIEFHPFIYADQKPILDFCKQNGIIAEAYSPLARGQAMHNQVIMEIADNLRKTAAQIMLRWAHQHGTVPIPKSAHPGRIKENIDIFNFELSDKQMSELNSLSGGY